MGDCETTSRMASSPEGLMQVSTNKRNLWKTAKTILWSVLPFPRFSSKSSASVRRRNAFRNHARQLITSELRNSIQSGRRKRWKKKTSHIREVECLSQGIQNLQVLGGSEILSENTIPPPTPVDEEIEESQERSQTVQEVRRDCPQYTSVMSEAPKSIGYTASGLQMNDRVVWITDNLPQAGTVRWLGFIRNIIHAGVHFDNPVGNSSGLYGYGRGLQKRLFTCKVTHGRFVPVDELIMYSTYYGSESKAGMICIICRDDFFESWNSNEDLLQEEQNATVTNPPAGPSKFPENKLTKGSSFAVASKCGHLFHHNCLSRWFNVRKQTLKNKQADKKHPCPYCNRPIDLDEIIRLYPAQT